MLLSAQSASSMGISFLSKADSSTSTSCGHPKSLRAECCPHRLQARNGLVVHLHHQLDGAAEKEGTGLDTERMTLWTTRGSEQRVSVLWDDESLALLTSTTTARKFSCSHRQGAYNFLREQKGQVAPSEVTRARPGCVHLPLPSH